jgi:hypothetical protein
MAIRTYTSKETWTVLVTYVIDSDTREEGEEDIEEGNPTHKDFEIVGRKVEQIIDVEENEM